MEIPVPDMTEHKLDVVEFMYFSTPRIHIGSCSCGTWASGKQPNRQDVFEAFGQHYAAKTLPARMGLDAETKD